MPTTPRPPLTVRICGWMAGFASRLVPPSQRSDWTREWQAEIWHRWQFLAHAGAWTNRESFSLLRRSLGLFPDAIWCFARHESVQSRLREGWRSPWTCLGLLAAALLLLAVLSTGFPATRGLIEAGTSSDNSRLAFIWFHPLSGGGDEGLPPDAVNAWANRSQLLAAVAPFVVSHQSLHIAGRRAIQPLVVRTEASLFRVLNITPAFGRIPANGGVVLTHALWHSLSHNDPRLLGRTVRIGRHWYPIAAVLPADFRFLSREPAAYLVQSTLPDAQQMVVARLKPGVSERALDKELTRIAESACYYFFRSQLRYSFLNDAAWIPLRFFFVAILSSALLVLLVSRVPVRRLAEFLRSRDRRLILRRVSFFSAKVALASLLIFIAVLEWSRSQTAILYGSRDPAAGPVLLWLYILGSMGVLFWAIADQRARCRVCLRLLCFPVRVGCPGCLLLNWSGTELLCPEGHGMMHVPDLAPSWDEESERWIALDDSWKDLFAEAK